VATYIIPNDYKGNLQAVIAEVSVAAEAVPIVIDPKVPVIQPIKGNSCYSVISGVPLIGLAIGLLLAPVLAKKFKGMSASEMVATIFNLLRVGNKFVVQLLSGLLNRI